MFKKVRRNENRKKRHFRVRNKVHGTPERPRLNVFRSAKHIYAQVIDDVAGNTLVAASTLDKEIKESVKYTGNKEAARLVGKLVAQRALEKGIETVVFDRGGYLYHGRVKELAEGAREAGLKF
ncbi:50S ribosomal protein L18 [Caloranaerobacter azorensis]|uniref:Large ribosomal subunit protein uL18 n=3 Tax=Caloranaerobacter azorensis TaxID=116090 RepID=A0A1M5TYJ6_9FIRM|nr:50S ribosomal protein L18 [Caloranaerobacter azorensis]KGG81018.1 50S ribosomal protein L18 [Caloranaerobacter azorensis H53214]QIB27129.1 50S ribosomal protein L18 [Caloranaerobacter azorensis]SHH55857.1 LSU ribosomal protein L18P [Caloranaerobacter azorensis DSM 13643]